jgi:hypothetical protein
MMTDEFRRQYMNGSWPSEEEMVLRQLAEEYHERCEQYDVGVCSGRRDGIAVPRTSEETRLINVNARRVLDDLTPRANAAGYSREALIRAIQKAAR